MSRLCFLFVALALDLSCASRFQLQQNLGEHAKKSSIRVNSSNRLQLDHLEPGGVAAELDETWQDDEATAGPLKMDDYKGNIDKGVGFIGAAVKEARSPNIANAGAALQAAGSLVSIIPYPPVAQAVGIGLYLIGGLMSAFAPAAATAPSNTDVINALSKGLSAIDGKLDKVSEKIDDVLAATTRLQHTMDVMTRYLGDVYKAVVLRDNQLQDVDDRYAASMFMLKAILTTPGDAAMEHYKSYVKESRNAVEQYVFGVMSPDNVDKLLQFANDAQLGGTCSVVLTYHSILATRFKLHWLLTAGALFESGADTFVLPYAEKLQEDLQAYVTLYSRIKFITGLMSRSDDELRSCLEVKVISADKSLAIGLENSTGCPNGYQPITSGEEACNSASMKFHGRTFLSVGGYWSNLPSGLCMVPVNTVIGMHQFFHNQQDACNTEDAWYMCPNPGAKWYPHPRPVCKKMLA